MLLRVWKAAAKLWRKEHEKKNLNLNSGARAAAAAVRASLESCHACLVARGEREITAVNRSECVTAGVD